MWIYFHHLLLIVLSIAELVTSVRINRLQVPEVTQLGDPVVLDCDYSLEESLDEGLVVKWYFNEKPTPIYQWIPNSKPLDIGILKGRVNLEYSASDDTNSVHRAVHIIEPGPELSGDYTCSVSTFSSEDRKTKRMLVFVPEKNLELRQEYRENGYTQVVCLAEGVFPRPTMLLTMSEREVNNSVLSVQKRGGLFDIKVVAEMPSLNAPEEFSCELHVPQANYTVKKEAMYYPVTDGSTSSPRTTRHLFFFIVSVHIIFFTCKE